MSSFRRFIHYLRLFTYWGFLYSFVRAHAIRPYNHAYAGLLLVAIIITYELLSRQTYLKPIDTLTYGRIACALQP